MPFPGLFRGKKGINLLFCALFYSFFEEKGHTVTGHLKSCRLLNRDVQFFNYFSLENCTKQDFYAIFTPVFKVKLHSIRIVSGYKSDWRHFKNSTPHESHYAIILVSGGLTE